MAAFDGRVAYIVGGTHRAPSLRFKKELDFPKGAILAVHVKGVQHEGIYTGVGTVVHKAYRTRKVVEEPLARFGHRRMVYQVGCAPDPDATIERARKRLGERWTVLNNCQRFVAEVSGTRRRSRDADSVFVAIVGLATVAGRLLRG